MFDLQTAVAESFGYRSQALDGARLALRASETLMRRYYWAAKAVSQLCQILLLNIEERLDPPTQQPRPINDRFLDKGGMIDVASDDLYQRDPHAILETFCSTKVRPGCRTFRHARCVRCTTRVASWTAPSGATPPTVRPSCASCSSPQASPRHAADEPDLGAGALPVAVPAHRGAMQHDLFHVYTVDQHILMVLRNVRRFFIAEHAHEYPFCSQLAVAGTSPGCCSWPRCSTTSARGAAATIRRLAPWKRGAFAASMA